MRAFLFLIMAGLLSSCVFKDLKELYSENEVIERYASYESGSRFITIDNKKIHYRMEGQGPVLVLVHGTIDSLHTWDLLMPTLKQYFKVFRFDIPGFGLSDPFDEIPSDQVVEESVVFMDKLFKTMKLEKFSMMGNSLGGLLTWYYAYHHPEKVEKVVLLDSAAYVQDFPWIFDASNPIYKFVVSMGGKYFGEDFIRLFGNKIPGVVGESTHPKFVKEQLRRIGMMFQSEGNVESYMNLLEVESSYDFRHSSVISKIKAPMFIIYGANDKVIPPSIQLPRFVQDRPNDRYYVFPEGAHVPHWENPHDLLKLIVPFLVSK